MKYQLASALSAAFLFQHVIASLRLVPLEFNRVSKPGLGKRDSNPVVAPLQNYNYTYLLTVSVGTSPQITQLGIDTGSRDTWLLGPDECESVTACHPFFDYTKSSTSKVVNKGFWREKFGSGRVQGDLVMDVFRIGDSNITDFTFGVVQLPSNFTFGFMGLGRNSSTDFPPILSSMVSQQLISSHSFSIWTNDINQPYGSLIFGGYDAAKFEGEMAILNVQPDPSSGQLSSGNIAWTSLAVTDSHGSTLLSPADFPLNAGLDTATTVLQVPKDTFQQLVNYFEAENDPTYGVLVNCNIKEAEGQLDFGFGNATIISVPFTEFLSGQVRSLDHGDKITLSDGTNACSLLISPSPDNVEFILGDAFMRSAYVIYDLDAQQVGIAQTKFNTTDSSLVEINSNSSSPTGNGRASLSISGATVATPVTLAAALTNTASSTYTFGPVHTGLGVVSGVPTSLPVSTFSPPPGTAANTAAPTSSSSAAAPLDSVPFLDSTFAQWVMAALIVMGGAFGF